MSRRDGLPLHMPRSGVHRIQLPRSVRPPSEVSSSAASHSVEGQSTAPSSLPRRSYDLMVADSGSASCDLLVEELRLHHAVTRASSIQDAVELLRTMPFHVALVSLDLHPAPQGGVKLADFALSTGVPVALLTRSLRWIPASSPHLHLLSWAAPESTAAEVEGALHEALSRGTNLGRAETETGRESIGF